MTSKQWLSSLIIFNTAFTIYFVTHNSYWFLMNAVAAFICFKQYKEIMRE